MMQMNIFIYNGVTLGVALEEIMYLCILQQEQQTVTNKQKTHYIYTNKTDCLSSLSVCLFICSATGRPNRIGLTGKRIWRIDVKITR